MRTSATYIRILSPALLCIYISTAMTSCSTMCKTTTSSTRLKKPKVASVQEEPVKPVVWKMMREDPPTFFPEGVPKNAKTNYEHGEWVYAGGAKWYIPKGGVNGHTTKQLRDDAFAKLNAAEKRKAALEKGGITVGKLAWTSVLLSATVVCGMGGGDFPLGNALETVWSY